MLLSPIGNSQTYGIDGLLLVGGMIFTYDEGTTTPAPTYGNTDGTIVQTNPIILNVYGMPDDPIWLANGLKYKLVFKDANNNLLWTYDNISGINDTIEEIGKYFGQEWILGNTPVYLTPDSFYLIGDKTETYHQFRRLKLAVLADFLYGYIFSSTYNPTTDRTTIVMNMDDGLELTELLSQSFYSILSYAPQAYPNFLSMAQWQKRGNDLTIEGGAITTWETSGNFSHVKGTGEVISLGVADQEGPTKYLQFDDEGVLIKNNDNIRTPQGVDLALVAGDIIEVFAGADRKNYVALVMSNKPTLIPTWDAPLTTRQTILIGPSKVQNPSADVASYYEVPPFPMSSNNQNGYTASGVSNYMSAFYYCFDKNNGTEARFGNNQYFYLLFAEPYYVDKFTFIDNYTTIQVDTWYVDYMDLTGAWVRWYTSGYNQNPSNKTYNMPLTLMKGILFGGYNVSHVDWYVRDFYVYGYRQAEITEPTVATQVESLLIPINYIQTSPIMLSANQNGYVVTASSETGTNAGWKAFSGTTSSYWESGSATNQWIKMQFPYAVKLGRIKMTAASTNANEMPNNFYIEGSNDDVAWDKLGEWVNNAIWVANTSFNYDFDNRTEYLYYRLTILTNQGGVKILIGELSYQSIIKEDYFGKIEINAIETQTVISIANGFNKEGQKDFTIALPLDDFSVPIERAAINWIYLRYNEVSGQINYESKQFRPIYGLYQPSFDPYIPTLIRGDGTDGSTDIFDSYGNKELTLQGTISISATNPKFGNGSLFFASAGSVLKVKRNMGMARERWTIDFWWKPTTLTGIVGLVATDPAYSVMLSYGRTAGKLSLYLSSDGTTWNLANNIAGTYTNFVVGTWYYIRVTFLGRRYMVFVDGVKDIEVSNTNLIRQITSMNIGAWNGETNSATGYIDEYRFRPSLGGYYSDITPILPTEAPVYVKPWIFSITEMNGYEKEEDGTLTFAHLINLGESITTEIASWISSPITYAYNGRKQVAWTTIDPAVDSWIALPHNIGTELITPDVNFNSVTAGSPYDSQSILPIDGLGMYNGAVWGGIPIGQTVDRVNFKFRYPANSSADYVSAYGGSGVLASISGGAINVSATFTRNF